MLYLPEHSLARSIVSSWTQVIESSEKGEVNDREGDISQSCGTDTLVQAKDALVLDKLGSQLGGRHLLHRLASQFGRRRHATRILHLDLEKLHGRGDDNLECTGQTAGNHLTGQRKFAILGGQLVAEVIVGGQLDGLLRCD